MIKQIYIVSFEPDGIPQTVDGEWAGALSAWDSKEEAESEVERIMNDTSGDYSWLGSFVSYYDNGEQDMTSSRQLRLAVATVDYHFKEIQ